MNTSPVRFGPWTLRPFDPEVSLAQLDDELGPCRMACRFCPHGWEPERPPLPQGEAWEAVVAGFRALVAAAPTPGLMLVAMDVLELPGIFELLGIARAAGKKVTLGTPALRAADPVVAARLAVAGATVALTWLAHEPSTWEEMSGRPDARELTERAVMELKAAGVPIVWSTVITDVTAPELDGIVADVFGRFGATTLRVHLFWPDVDPTTRPAYPIDQFPDLEALRMALVRASALGLDPKPHLVLGNVPLCQLDLDGLPGLRIEVAAWRPGQNHAGRRTILACTTCEARERCVGMHPRHATRDGFDPPPPHRLARNLARIPPETSEGASPSAVLPGQGIPKGQGVPKGQGIPKGQGLLPGQGIPKDQGRPPR